MSWIYVFFSPKYVCENSVISAKPLLTECFFVIFASKVSENTSFCHHSYLKIITYCNSNTNFTFFAFCLFSTNLHYLWRAVCYKKIFFGNSVELLQCFSFRRLSRTIFVILKCFNFRETEICRAREIEMFLFGRLNCVILGDWNMAFSRYCNTSISRRLKFVFSRDWACNFQEIKMFFFRGIEHELFGELKCYVFEKWKNWTVQFLENWILHFLPQISEKLKHKKNWKFKPKTKRKTENLNLKQKVNQSTPAVLPTLTGFVMRYNQPASFWTSYLWKLSPKI